MYDLHLRDRNIYSSFSRITSGQQLLLHSSAASLNILTFFININNLYFFLNRSRNEDNTGESDYFFYDEDDSTLAASSIKKCFDFLSEDVRSDMHYSVDESLVFGSFYFYGHQFGFESVNLLISFSYADYFIFMLQFIYLFKHYLFCMLLQIVFFFSLYFFSYYLCCIRCVLFSKFYLLV